MSGGDDPWAPDLTTGEGRRSLEARIARAPATLVLRSALGPGAPAELPSGRPRLVVGVAAAGAAALVTLDHVVRPDAGAGGLLRRRLAVLCFDDPEDPAIEDAVVAWSVLAREHATLVADRAGSLARARRLAEILRA